MKEIILYILKKLIDLQSRVNYDDKKNPRKVYIFKNTVQSGVQVGDIEHVIVWNMKENSNLKIVEVPKFMSKSRLNHLLLSITCNDTHWRSQLDCLHLSIQRNNKGHHEKKSNLNNALLWSFGLWPKKIMVLIYQSTFWVHFTVLAPDCTSTPNSKPWSNLWHSSNRPKHNHNTMHIAVIWRPLFY